MARPEAAGPTSVILDHGGRWARGLGAAVGTGALVVSAHVARGGAGVPCPFLHLTGCPCPLCGGTRSVGALLHGEVATAFALHPVAPFLALAAVIGVLLFAAEAVAGRQILPEPVWSRFLQPVGWILVGVWVVRLLLVAAFGYNDPLFAGPGQGVGMIASGPQATHD